MKTVHIRNTIIGEGVPKICVPIVGQTKAEILAQAAALKETPTDVAEWRADWFDQVLDHEKVTETLAALKKALGDLPLLVTFRTASEGGEKTIGISAYIAFYKAVIDSGLADLIDVELFIGDDAVREIIAYAHADNVRVIVSNHDFDKTPPKEELIRRLCKMDRLGADLPKIAVMPTCRRDVLTLLDATLEMRETYTDKPLITMAMAGTGLVSRLCGETFGSALTFGAAGKASAPGQMNVADLHTILQLIHTNS